MAEDNRRAKWPNQKDEKAVPSPSDAMERNVRHEQLTADHEALMLGLHFRYLGMYELALNAFMSAEREAQLSGNTHLLTESLMWQGECFKLLNRYTEAVAAFGRALSLYALGGFRGELALRHIYIVKFTLLEIGQVMLPDSPRDRLPYLDSLAVAAEDTLSWLQSVGKFQWRSAVLLQLADILEELERWVEAIAASEEALAVRLHYDEGPRYTIGGHLITLANILRRAGKINDALDVIDRILTGRELSVSDIIDAKLTQARILLDMPGRALTACDKAREGVRLADGTEGAVKRVTARLTLARALALTSQWTEALEAIDQAMRLQRGDNTSTGRTMRRHLRNALADLHQSATVEADALNHLSVHITELGPEEEPWGESTSQGGRIEENTLRWDEKTMIPEMPIAEEYGRKERPDVISVVFPPERILLLATLHSWIVETFELLSCDREELLYRLEEALATRDDRIRIARVAKVVGCAFGWSIPINDKLADVLANLIEGALARYRGFAAWLVWAAHCESVGQWLINRLCILVKQKEQAQAGRAKQLLGHIEDASSRAKVATSSGIRPDVRLQKVEEAIYHVLLISD